MAYGNHIKQKDKIMPSYINHSKSETAQNVSIDTLPMPNNAKPLMYFSLLLLFSGGAAASFILLPSVIYLTAALCILALTSFFLLIRAYRECVQLTRRLQQTIPELQQKDLNRIIQLVSERDLALAELREKKDNFQRNIKYLSDELKRLKQQHSSQSKQHSSQSKRLTDALNTAQRKNEELTKELKKLETIEKGGISPLAAFK